MLASNALPPTRLMLPVKTKLPVGAVSTASTCTQLSLANEIWGKPMVTEASQCWEFGKWRSPELCCPPDIAHRLIERCWNDDAAQAAFAAERCCRRPWILLAPFIHRASALQSEVSCWCSRKPRFVSRSCCDVYQYGAGGDPNCWKPEYGITFAACCVTMTGLLGGSRSAEEHAGMRWSQVLSSNAPPLMDETVSHMSNGCWGTGPPCCVVANQSTTIYLVHFSWVIQCAGTLRIDKP